jgi:SUMO ligase MMS21 Smc5/6 complex component
MAKKSVVKESLYAVRALVGANQNDVGGVQEGITSVHHVLHYRGMTETQSSVP